MKRVLIFIGPLPPPVNGQNYVTGVILDKLREVIGDVFVVNTAGNAFIKLYAHAKAIVVLFFRRGPIYLSLNSNSGFWLSALIIAFSSLLRRNIYIHHHAYGIFSEANWIRRFVLAFFHERSVHLALGRDMENRLKETSKKLKIVVLNNAGFISEPKRMLKARIADEISIGFLSNLTLEKGLDRVIELSCAVRSNLCRSVKLHLAGPLVDQRAMRSYEDAKTRLGDDLIYWGPVNEEAKKAFFEKIDFFCFPSSYKNEAAPLVVYEAQAAAVPVIATSIGCLGEMIAGRGGVAVGLVDEYVSSGVAYIRENADALEIVSSESKEQFYNHRAQFGRTFELLTEKIKRDLHV